MTQSDPTDEALATIASILETPTTGSPPIAPSEADGYTKIGPGPIASIRFRWSVRRGGPMSAEAAMKLVDERESDAHSRFEQIRREMISRGASAYTSADALRKNEE